MSGYTTLLRENRDFARLWLAQVISLLGDWFNTIVLSALVVRYTDGTGYEGIALSGYLMARLIPPLLVSPFAGVLVDRFNRKRLLIASDVLRAGVVIMLLFAIHPDRLWLIYVLTIIQFMLSAVFEPGRNALMPNLLEEKDLVQANTLSSVTWSVMLAIGAIIGGIVASIFGISAALLIDAGTFLLSALLIYAITPREKRKITSQESPEATSEPDTSFRDGLRYFFRNPATAAAILVKAGLSIGSVDAVLIIYGTRLFVLGVDGTTSMAILWSAFGVGAILGPILLNRFSDGSVRVLRRLVIVGFVWVTLGWFLFGAAPTLELAVLALIVRAMGGSVNWTYSSVIIQKTVPDHYLGRMFSLDFAGFQLLQGTSVLVVGMLIDTIGAENVRQVVMYTGIASFVPLILWIWAIMTLERRETIPAIGGD